MVNKIIKIGCLFILLLIIAFFSLTNGDVEITTTEMFLGMKQQSTDVINHVITQIRLPRVIAGSFVGATLAASGFLTSIAMRNDLADSGILGVQSGATIGALTVLLLLPGAAFYLPIASVLGGLLAFLFILLATGIKRHFDPVKVVLVGVAINSMATSVIGIISLLNTNRMRGVLTWLNGSVASVTAHESRIIMIWSAIFIIVTLLALPLIRLLLLSDNEIKNIGFKPVTIRLVLSLLAVLLASISVAFVGILSFIGIIARQIAKVLEKNNLTIQLILALLIGAILVISADLFQRLVFSPVEIPAGILIGMIGAPIFIILASRRLSSK